MPKRRLGISADLIADIDTSVTEMAENVGDLDFRLLDVGLIDRDPDQPRSLGFVDPADLPALPDIDASDPEKARKRRALDKLRELADSVTTKGVLEPIEVYPVGNRFRVSFGERRWLASRMVGKRTVPARVLASRPADLAERQAIENLQREDLNLAEQLHSVRAIRADHKKRNGEVMTQQHFSTATGLSKSHASNLFTVCDAPDDVGHAIATGRLTDLAKAGIVARIGEPDDREAAIAAAADGASRESLRERVDPGTRPARSRGGRPPTRVSLGHTDDPAAVRRLLNKVLGPRRAAKQFADCNWDDPRQVSRAWQVFWNEFEASDAD